MTHPSFALGARQQMSISPRMQQAVKLLQMSALEFQQELQQQLADNPFLEEGDNPDTSTPADLHDAAPQALPDDPAQFDCADLRRDQATDADADDTPLDVADAYEASGSAFEATASDGGGSSADPWHAVQAETSLRSHLFEQLRGARLDGRSALAAGLVIEMLDDDGYLREDLAATAEALALDTPLDADDLAAGTRHVQQFDPPGIAARNLTECLALQLQLLAPQTPGRGLALRLIDGQLELLARHDYTSLRRRLDCSLQQLTVAHGLIRMLDPKPGARYTRARTEYVEPDVLIVEHRGVLSARVNPAVQPRARLNRSCADLMHHSGNSHGALRQQLQEARWLLRSVEQRQATIQRVADAIVACQRGFFQYGEVALKPLLLRDVADALGLHESTLSRATANKYMATPRGTYEFRHFFSRQLATDTGGTCSAAAVRALIKEMIDTESPEAPLSDVLLAKRLTDSGIQVARRTVAKYRNQMKVPPWELRYLP